MDKYLGKRLDGRYEMRELIGVGGMAYVYKAYDSVDDRMVAVKILRDEFLTNDEFVRRFRNESKAIAILNHPNIVKVLDVGFGQHLQYIVMEYIDGITLKEYLDQRKDIRWKEAVHFTVQILRALQHAHDKGIVHRDIKPQNIMLLSDGTIKVTDFGIARLSRSEMRATMDGKKAIGSVHYISPEQARGEITDEKTDLYSVGVVLYEMLIGRLPFEADNAVSVAIMQMQSEPTMPREINEDVPEGLEQITIRAMQKTVEKRYQSAAEMLSDIDEFKRNPSIKFAYTYFVDESPTRYADAITRVRGEEEIVTKQDAEAKKKKVSTVAILAAVAAAIVLATVIGVVYAIKLISKNESKGEINVVNFVGMNYEEEVKKHKDYAKFEIEEIYQLNNEQEVGHVFKQEPASGTIKENGKIRLYISSGTTKQRIPIIIAGEKLEDVQKKIEDAGFRSKEVLEPSAEVEKGKVIRIDPSDGEAPLKSEITIFVSDGEPELPKIKLPPVMNLTVDGATAELVKAGFDQTKITVEEVNSTIVKGAVIGTEPPANTEQYPNINIKLLVSSGYRDVNIAMPLPAIDTPIDLQFYVGGENDSALSKTNIMPKHIGTLNFATKLKKDSYNVSVMISVAGKNEFKTYAEYTVDGKTGAVLSSNINNPFVESTTTTTTTTTTASGSSASSSFISGTVVGTGTPQGVSTTTGQTPTNVPTGA